MVVLRRSRVAFWGSFKMDWYTVTACWVVLRRFMGDGSSMGNRSVVVNLEGGRISKVFDKHRDTRHEQKLKPHRLLRFSMGNKSTNGGGGDTKIEQPSPEELASMKPAGQKGWKFRVEAATKLSSRSPFSRESRLESAAELAEKAATQFKLAKMYDEAAECYSLQADALNRAKETMQAAAAMIQAAEVYGKHGGAESAYEVYMAAIEVYKDAGKFDRAAKHQQALAEVSVGRCHARRGVVVHLRSHFFAPFFVGEGGCCPLDVGGPVPDHRWWVFFSSFCCWPGHGCLGADFEKRWATCSCGRIVRIGGRLP
jgi:hypothetical protein